MIRKFFSPPIFDKEEDNFRAKFINIYAWISIFLILLGIPSYLQQEKLDFSIIVSIGVLVIMATAIYMLRRGKITVSGAIIIVAGWLSIGVGSIGANGVRGTSIVAYIALALLASITVGLNTGVIVIVSSIIMIWILALLEVNGYIIPTTTEITSYALTLSIIFIIIAVLIYFSTASLKNSAKRANNIEEDLRSSNDELQKLNQTLEQRVLERTSELENRSTDLESANTQIQRRSAQFEALAQVAQSITLIRDLQELLPNVAAVVAEKYGFYHVGVFLIDEVNEYAVLAAANSEGGKQMMERNHRLKVGEQGIVGSVTGTGIPRIALDVGADATYFNNPELPETHSEMALPLQAGDIVIGALDVQSKESGAFTDEDVQTLSLLADQVSLAIENARLFDEANKTLSDLQMVMRQSTRDTWKNISQQQALIGYRYNTMGATPLKEPVKLTGTGKGKKKDDRTETGLFVVPIELRGEIIGNLVVQSPTGDEWNEDQQDIIKAVAERVALSAENARLFEETTQRAERERLVSEITGKIRHHADPKTMIETAVSELKNALGASRIEIIPHKTANSGKKDTEV